MQQEIKVNEIVDYLVAVPAINAIVGSRVFRWEPVSDDQAGIYMTINLIWEQQQRANKATLLDFRFIWHNKDVSYLQLTNLKNLVTEQLVLPCSPIDFGTFIAYGISEGTGFVQGFSTKNNKLLQKDYLFYFNT